jgi:hypothetical protein
MKVGVIVSQSGRTDSFWFLRIYHVRCPKCENPDWQLVEEIPLPQFSHTSLISEFSGIVSEKYRLPLVDCFLEGESVCKCLPVLAILALERAGKLKNKDLRPYFENVTCGLDHGPTF